MATTGSFATTAAKVSRKESVCGSVTNAKITCSAMTAMNSSFISTR